MRLIDVSVDLDNGKAYYWDILMPANEQWQRFCMCQYHLAFGASICDGEKGLSRAEGAYFVGRNHHGTLGTKLCDETKEPKASEYLSHFTWK